MAPDQKSLKESTSPRAEGEDGGDKTKVVPAKPLPPRPPQLVVSDETAPVRKRSSSDFGTSNGGDNNDNHKGDEEHLGVAEANKDEKERRHAKKLRLKLKLKKTEYLLKIAERRVEDLELENETLKAELNAAKKGHE